jgi:TonB family protein
MLSGVSIFDEDNYRIDADTLSYGENADLIVFLKSDTSWTFSGFYGVFDSTEVLIALEDYTSQLFEFSHLIYDPYNGVQFDTDIEIIGEPIEEMNLEEDLYVYTFFELDQPPHFAGNAAAMYSFIASEMRYPEEVRIKKIEGIVFVGFIVEKDGTLSNIRIVSSPNVLLNDEALRIVKNMPPWIPAPHPWNKDRDALRAEHVIAIDFNLP